LRKCHKVARLGKKKPNLYTFVNTDAHKIGRPRDDKKYYIGSFDARIG
jgi:hypothetical protein